MLYLDALLTQCHLSLGGPLQNIKVRLLSVGQANTMDSMASPTDSVPQNPNLIEQNHVPSESVGISSIL